MWVRTYWERAALTAGTLSSGLGTVTALPEPGASQHKGEHWLITKQHASISQDPLKEL